MHFVTSWPTDSMLLMFLAPAAGRQARSKLHRRAALLPLAGGYSQYRSSVPSSSCVVVRHGLACFSSP